MKCFDLSRMTASETVPDSVFVVALGNFDGVHIAHRALIRTAADIAKSLSADGKNVYTAVFYFDTLPENVKEARVPLLCTEDEKLARLHDAGADYAFVHPFSELASLSPEAFVNRILLTECHAVRAVCGFNYRFGHRAAGTADTLRSLLPDGFVTVTDCIRIDGQTVSSTAIRKSLTEVQPQPQIAAQMLGSPFCISTTVTAGKHLGTDKGVPTVNQYFPDGVLVPRYGVYVTETTVDGVTYPSVSDVGVRPTVEDDARPRCETHILDFAGDLYGKTVSVGFLKYLRSERKFDSVEELYTAIANDMQEARKYRADR